MIPRLPAILIICICAASWIVLGSQARAADLNGAWATDGSVCNKVFIKKNDAISFQPGSDEFGGGFIMDGSRVRGQMQTCTIKSRKDDANMVHFLAMCASDIMASNVQFSARIIDANTIERFFDGMPDEMGIRYSRCAM
jgi:hypothetical protein